MVKEPEALDEENDRIDDTITNSSNNKQESIIVEDVDVRPNDHKVLEALKEDSSSYTFRGLMRKLNMHQESLSRSLQRLDELGLIEKSQLGYKLSKKGEFVRKGNVNDVKVAYMPLLQTYIPSNVDVSIIVNTLAGRWFKKLRWLGMVEGNRGCMLQWISEDGSFQLNLRIVNNYIIIETNANEKDKVEAMVCAYGMFEHISKLYRNKNNVFSYTFNSNIAN